MQFREELASFVKLYDARLREEHDAGKVRVDTLSVQLREELKRLAQEDLKLERSQVILARTMEEQDTRFREDLSGLSCDLEQKRCEEQEVVTRMERALKDEIERVGAESTEKHTEARHCMKLHLNDLEARTKEELCKVARDHDTKQDQHRVSVQTQVDFHPGCPLSHTGHLVLWCVVFVVSVLVEDIAMKRPCVSV